MNSGQETRGTLVDSSTEFDIIPMDTGMPITVMNGFEVMQKGSSKAGYFTDTYHRGDGICHASI